MKPAIEVKELSKTYGSLVAVNSLSLSIKKQTIFGLVGPNGAGKTTTIECLEGLRQPDSGKVRILGLDPLKQRYEILSRIGIQLQESGMYKRIKVREVFKLFSSFYERPLPWKELMIKFGLDGQENIYYDHLSGGQKRRCQAALALIGDPEVIFLDEATTGLDPQARYQFWCLIQEFQAQGKTIVVTTHYMEEAENYCNEVGIIDQGNLVAVGTPRELLKENGLENKVALAYLKEMDLEVIKSLPEVTRLEVLDNQLFVYGKDETLLKRISELIFEKGLPFKNMQGGKATLDDLFLLLTGREYRE